MIVALLCATAVDVDADADKDARDSVSSFAVGETKETVEAEEGCGAAGEVGLDLGCCEDGVFWRKTADTCIALREEDESDAAPGFCCAPEAEAGAFDSEDQGCGAVGVAAAAVRTIG